MPLFLGVIDSGGLAAGEKLIPTGSNSVQNGYCAHNMWSRTSERSYVEKGGCATQNKRGNLSLALGGEGVKPTPLFCFVFDSQNIQPIPFFGKKGILLRNGFEFF